MVASSGQSVLRVSAQFGNTVTTLEGSSYLIKPPARTHLTGFCGQETRILLLVALLKWERPTLIT